jgi:hypothetical protein
MPVRETVKTIVPLCLRWLGNCCHWQLHDLRCVLKKGRRNSNTSSVRAVINMIMPAGIIMLITLRRQATVMKSSPAPRVNSFHCSLKRHEITVYYFIHAITKLRHNIDLKEIQHLTGMTHCSSFSGMEQFGWTVNSFTPRIFLKLLKFFNFLKFFKFWTL